MCGDMMIGNPRRLSLPRNAALPLARLLSATPYWRGSNIPASHWSDVYLADFHWPSVYFAGFHWPTESVGKNSLSRSGSGSVPYWLYLSLSPHHHTRHKQVEDDYEGEGSSRADEMMHLS